MSQIIAVVLLFGVLCSAGTVHREHLQKRHLTPIGSIIHETASKLLNPLGIVRNAGSQSSSQSQSFSIGGSLLGLSGSLSAASSNANSFGGNGAASSSAGSSAGGSNSQAHSSSASQQSGFGNFGGVSNSQSQSSASSSNVGEVYVQPFQTNLGEMFAHNSNFQAQPLLNSQGSSFVSQAGSLGGGYNTGYGGGHKNIHSGVPITGNGREEVIGFEVKPIIAVRPPVHIGVGQGSGTGFSNSYSNSQASGFGGSYGNQKGTFFPAQTFQKPDAIIIATVENDNKRKNYPHYNNYHSTNYEIGNLERPGGVWENTKLIEAGNHGITGSVPVSHGVYGSGSQSASFSQANAQNFQGTKGTEFGGYASNGNAGLGNSLTCGHLCSRPESNGGNLGSAGGFSNAQSQSGAFKGQSNIETLDSAIGEVFGNLGGGSGSHSSSQSNSQSSNYGGFNKSGSQSSSSSQSHGGSSSSSSQASSYSKSDSLIFY